MTSYDKCLSLTLTSLSIILPRSTHVAAILPKYCVLFFFYGKVIFHCIYTQHQFYFSLGCSHILATVNSLSPSFLVLLSLPYFAGPSALVQTENITSGQLALLPSLQCSNSPFSNNSPPHPSPRPAAEPQGVATWPQGLLLDVTTHSSGSLQSLPPSQGPRPTPLASPQEYLSEATKSGQEAHCSGGQALENSAVLPGVAGMRKRKTAEGEERVEKLFRSEQKETL